MATFSERHGYRPVRSVIQVESMDDDLRTDIWNVLTVLYWNRLGTQHNRLLSSLPEMRQVFMRIWINFFRLPLDSMPTTTAKVRSRLRAEFFEWEWFDVYDFVEFMVGLEGDEGTLAGHCNTVLERNMAGYRFVGKLLTPVTNEQEVAAVELAMASAAGRLTPVGEHLRRALEHMSDRQSPDYRNSIKESISAVESLCSIIAGRPTTLGQALKQVEKDINLHSALKQAFQKLYGYTSDADGIRHGLMDESTLALADARFMLVSCSAFVSYLTDKAAAAGLDLQASAATAQPDLTA